MALSEIGSSITYIPMETSALSLLNGRIWRIEMTDELIFIDSALRPLLAFDHSGKFVRQYGHIGRGPGEYHSINDFTLSADRSKVFLMAHYFRGYHIYDINGKYLSSVNKNIGLMSNILSLDDTTLVYGKVNRPLAGDESEVDKINASVVITDSDNNIRKTYLYKVRPQGRFMLMNRPIYKSQGNIRFWDRHDKSLLIYTVT